MDVRKKSQMQEKSVAKAMSAKVTPASGALWGSKGDVRSDAFLIECKITKELHYSLHRDIWRKIRREAIHDGLRIPVLCVDFEDGKSRVAVVETFSLEAFSPVLFRFLPENHKYVDAKSFRVTKEPYSVSLSKKDWETQSLTILDWDIFLQVMKEVQNEQSKV